MLSIRDLRTGGLCLSLLVFISINIGLWGGGSHETEGDESRASHLELTDQTGRTVRILQPVSSVVTIPIPAASLMIAVDGGTDRLSGMHPSSKSALAEGILGEFFPEALEINSDVVGEGFTPNTETLLTVNPDLVFQWGHLGTGVVDPLENAGLNTFLLMYGTQEDLETWITTFGKILGREEKAQRIIDWHHETYGEMADLTSAIPEDDKPRVLYFLRYLSSKRVAGSGTYNDFYLNFTGGVNAASELEGFADVSEEQIIAWDPEIIYLNGFESALKPEDVYANPRLADVSAVRNRRVYKLPLGGYRWDPPNQESPLMWKWMAMVNHPGRFNWDIRGEITANYEWIYGKKPDESQLDAILHRDINGLSDGYAVFE